MIDPTEAEIQSYRQFRQDFDSLKNGRAVAARWLDYWFSMYARVKESHDNWVRVAGVRKEEILKNLERAEKAEAALKECKETIQRIKGWNSINLDKVGELAHELDLAEADRDRLAKELADAKAEIEGLKKDLRHMSREA